MLFFSFILLVIVMALGTYVLTHAYFSDVVVSASNTFTTAENFGTPMPTPGNEEPLLGKIVINEVSMDGDTNREWIELFNAGGQNVDVSGWTITDGDNSMDTIPLSTAVIPAGGFVVIVTNNTIVDTSGVPAIIIPSLTIGNGLADAGDAIILKNGLTEVDTMSYGNDVSVFNPSANAPTVAGDTSRRVPNGEDTDVAGDWQVGISSLGISN